MAPITVGFHFQQYRSLTAAHPIQRNLGSAAYGQHIHAVDLYAGDAEALTAAIKLIFGRSAVDAGAHCILVVFNHENDGQFPKLRHVEAFIYLPLIGSAVAKIGKAHAAIIRIFMPKGKARAERYLCPDNPVSAVKFMFGRKHVH